MPAGTLRLPTGGLYLTNYVTSEGNWLLQIVFRGFISKGVNTYACTTVLEFWTILDYFVYAHCLKSPKNLFKLQVIM